MQSTIEAIPERVAAGTAFLNQQYGVRWPASIDIETFSLTSPCRCVLGQLEGGFYTACEVFGLVTTGEYASLDWTLAAELGFYAAADDADEWDCLEREWVAFIRSYQEAVQ